MNIIKTLYNRLQTINMFVAVLLVLMLMNNCQELEFPDPNGPSLDQANTQSLVTGIEAAMRNQLNVYLLANSVIGRETYNFDPADPGWVEEIYSNLDAGGFITLNPWEERYRVILNCNLLKEVEPNNAGVQGFANTIIAYQLLLMANYTYDNGIKTDFSGVLDNFTSDNQESYQVVAQYLDEAAAQLSGAGGSFSFTLTPGFAGFNTPATFRQFNQALRARVALYLQDWQGALNALNESFLNTGGDLNAGVYHVYGAGLGDQLNPIFESPTASFVKFRAHPSFKTDAETGDTRYTSKIVDRTGDPNFAPGFGDTGLSSSVVVAVSSGSTAPFPIIRNEELILIRAEANINLGNFAAGEADLNIVRAAAGLAGYSGTNAGNAVDRLLHERRYSLFVEGHRWVDMRRYDRLTQLPVDRPGDVVQIQFPRPISEVSGG